MREKSISIPKANKIGISISESIAVFPEILHLTEKLIIAIIQPIMKFSPRSKSASTIRAAVGSGCSPAPNDGRYYAGAKAKTVNSPIGVMAQIKTVYTKLCMEPTGTDYGSQSAWGNVTNFTSTQFWAEVGWTKFRPPGGTTIVERVFGEIGIRKYAVTFIYTSGPADDSLHTYKCELTD